MQAPHNNKHKAPKFIDIKLFIAALTLAITIGLWNLLSNDLFESDKLAPTAVVNVPAQPPAGVAQDLPPLPTLIPLIPVDLSKTSAIVPASSVKAASSFVQPAQLRAVAVPTQTIIQQAAIQVGSGGGGGGAASGGGGGGGGGHHASSHSSHK